MQDELEKAASKVSRLNSQVQHLQADKEELADRAQVLSQPPLSCEYTVCFHLHTFKSHGVLPSRDCHGPIFHMHPQGEVRACCMVQKSEAGLKLAEERSEAESKARESAEQACIGAQSLQQV